MRNHIRNTKFIFDDHSEVVPPDPIPNSVVKHFCADGSVGFPHVRVGHHQITFCPDSSVGRAGD